MCFVERNPSKHYHTPYSSNTINGKENSTYVLGMIENNDWYRMENM